ncbi:Alpha/Beta hydrolase protein [Xylariaceae sp. FL0662B]|nr:Alpha/Beta hydrolase protein [Xylariaceae sp. FL0662B]
MPSLLLLLLLLLLLGAEALATPNVPLLPPRRAPSTSSSSGCGSPAPPAAPGLRTNATLPGSGRPYMYWVPPGYEAGRPTPLVLSFHGAGRTPDLQADLDLLTDPFFNPGYVVVYPSAAAAGGYWQGAPGAGEVDDVGYVMEVLDAVQEALCVDTARIYATGKSQGGMMTNTLACDPGASRRIAAFAPVSGSYYVATENGTGTCDPATVALPCAPGRAAVPLLAFHGGRDGTIAIGGGPRKGACLPDVRYWVRAWAARDGLGDGTPPGRQLTAEARIYEFGGGPGDGGHGEGDWYEGRDGDGGREGNGRRGLVTFVYDGDRVDHDWPATVPNSDNIVHGSGPASFNASRLIMEFFARYTLPDDDDDNGRVRNTRVSSTIEEGVSGGMTTRTSIPGNTTMPTSVGSTIDQDVPVQTAGSGKVGPVGVTVEEKILAVIIGLRLASFV